MFTKEMMAALAADGEKLRQMTGEDHGPYFVADEEPDQALVATDVCLSWKCDRTPLELRGELWCCPRCGGCYGTDAKQGM